MFTRNLFGCQLWWSILVLLEVSGYPSRPNVVFIMVDDMGWNDVSFHGSDQIQTPNLDSLAYQGVILQQYYSEAICTPARTALLTGKYPMRLGMHGRPLSNAEDRGIPLTERLLPSYMKELGYATHLVGKWHVGMSRDEFLPTKRGYDSHYGMRGGFIDYYTYNKVEPSPSGRTMSGLDFFDNDIPQVDESRYIIDALTDRAIRIIGNHNLSQPLFLHLTHNAPHAGNGGGSLQPPLYTSVKNRHIANSDRRLFAEIVTHLDRSVGRLVHALSERDILDDTIIVFVSDNGAPTVGEFANWGVNLPFRGRKETPWEGAVRVPAFIWHSDFRPRVWTGLMHITDWLPTLIAAAGGRVDKEIDGINQWDSIAQDGQSQRKEVLIAIEEGSENTFAAYRAGDYKIVVGNVTGLNNGYYGAEYMENKQPPPEYYTSLRICDVSSSFSLLRKYLDVDTVEAMRKATAIRQEDLVVDATPCEPTPFKGCLFNVRRDPAERHDLWLQAGEIVSLMTSRLRGLWAQQTRRGPPVIMQAADPANFGYNWMPFINNGFDRPNKSRSKNTRNQNQFEKLSRRLSIINNTISNTTIAGQINCNGSTYIRNFLCILRSVF